MATITLKYDAGNKLARKAIEDIERGNVIHCGSFEEFVTGTHDDLF